MKKLNPIVMRRKSVVSFPKSVIDFLTDWLSRIVLSGEKAGSSTRFRRFELSQSLFRILLILLISSVFQKSVFGQECNPLFKACPGDIVVYVQPGTCGNIVTWSPPAMITPCPGYSVTSNYNPGDYLNSGTTEVVYYSWFGTEKKDSCKFNVIVADNQKPTVNCKDTDLYLGPSGTVSLKASDIDNGSSDNCSLTLIPSKTVFTCADAGQTIPVILTGTDPSGNISTCTAQVTVHDTTRPVIITKDFTLRLDNTGSGTINASDIDNGTYDNCGTVSLSVTPTSFSCTDQGISTVTFSATDSHGNTATAAVQIDIVSTLKINSISLSNCDVAGTYALFNSNVTGGDGNYFYFWDCLDESINPFVKNIPLYPFVTFENTSTEITPFFNNNIPDGTYDIRLVITDGNGCTDTSDMIIVKSGPVYSNITRRYSTACEGGIFTYTVNPDPVATFNWQVINGTVTSSPPYTNSIDVLWNPGFTQGVVTAIIDKMNILDQPCSSTVIDSVDIDLLSPPVFDGPATDVCAGSETTYKLTLPYSDYEWNVTGGVIVDGGPGSNFVTVRWNSAPAGRVDVIASTGSGCSASAYIDVVIDNLSGSVISVTNITCNGSGDGMVTVEGTAGTGVLPYEYSLDGGTFQSSGSFTGIEAGSHIVTIRDALLCSYDVSFVITQPQLLIASVTKTDVSCFGDLTGEIVASASGGASPYEYSLNGAPFQSSGIFTNLPAGNHNLIVKDANSCIFSQKIDITQPDLLTGSASVTAPVECYGGTATVTLIAEGGTLPLSFTFNGVTNTTGVFPDIPAGAGNVWSITDANGCGPVTGTLDVSQPLLLTGTASVTTPVSCNGGTATITLTGSGGTAPLSFTFNGITNPTGIFTGIPSGTGYSWSITDSNGCGPVSGTVNVTEPAIISGSASVTVPILCNGGTGTVRIEAGGGTPPLSYTFNGSTNSTGIFTGIIAGTGYIWSVNDANGCPPAGGTVDVTEPQALTGSASVSIPVQCYGGTGTVILTGSGGTSPLSYTFNGVTNTTGVFGGVSAGTGYPWSITDINNCDPVTGTIDITEPEALTGSASVTEPVVCFGGTATVTITGSGGTAPLSYTFNGVTNSTGIFPGIPAGTGYSWSITDLNNCGPFTGILEVTEPQELTGSASVTVPVPCNGGTATVTITASGGTNPISYTFNGVTNTTGIFAGIPAGAGYGWSITDAGNCGPVTGTLDIAQPSGITGSAAITAPVVCNGENATVTLTGGGGTDPLSYTLNGVTNTTGIFSIAAGTGYLWSINDANGCPPATGIIDINEPDPLTGSASVTADIICNGGTATITISGSGGTAPLSYTFNGVTNTTGIFPGIPAGTAYPWSITDAGNCGPVTGVLDVIQPPLLTATASVTTPVPCPGSTATVTLTASGGTQPLSFTFNGVTNATGIFTGIVSGSDYAWSVNDAAGCGPVTGTISVTEPSIISGSAIISNPVPCNGGTAIVTINGEGGTLPYSFTFDGVTNTTGIFSGIPAGTAYTWIINDANGCPPASGTIDVTEPEVISGSASITAPIICYAGTATVTLTGNGGTAPLIYTFNGINNVTGIFTGITAGASYNWNITDANNCSPVAGTIDITEPPELIGTIVLQNNVTVIGGDDGSVTVEASGGSPPYLYRLNTGSYQASGTFSNLTAGNYTITVQDAALCEDYAPVTITDPTVPLSGSMVSKKDVSCYGGSDGNLTVTGIAGIAPYEYSLDGGVSWQSSGTFTNLPAATYIVTIRDAKPALFDVTVILDEPETAVSVVASGINNLCNGDNSGKVIAVASGGTGPYEFSWDTAPVQLNDTASNIEAGTYTVTVTDANGCIAKAETTITEPAALILSTTTTEADCPDTNDGSITLSISGGTAPYTTLWQDGNESQNRTEMLAGNYTVVVTDTNNCQAMTTATVGFIGTFGCVEIPQIITPNNDGFNDEWRIRNIDLYPDAEALVYTRWGKLVYKSRNISAGPWDGRFGGRLLPTDSYHYILYLNDGSKPRSGVISIIR